MIYRFRAKLAIQDRLNAFVVPELNSEKFIRANYWYDKEGDKQLVDADRSHPDCKIFRVRAQDEAERGLQFRWGRR